jgi:hypothetical protein
MINIDRAPVAPTFLADHRIRQYIIDAIAYMSNPLLPEPKKPLSYRKSNLLEAFDRDFFSKCYLTEEKFPNSWIMDIEHFKPQNERPDLVYEWTNLFPAAHLANMIKPRSTPAGGLLDPSDPTDNVETEIQYALSSYGDTPSFGATDPANVRAVNTANLLNRVHNGHDKDSRKSTDTLRHVISKRYIEILHKIIEWERAAPASQEKFQAQTELKSLLSRRSSFTMLIRSIPAVRTLPADFFD